MKDELINVTPEVALQVSMALLMELLGTLHAKGIIDAPKYVENIKVLADQHESPDVGKYLSWLAEGMSQGLAGGMSKDHPASGG